ncbi:MAG TPA: pirin family protein [Segeticoccus sp.]|uniref:pirin family protein n=1 Tax=Segeticoccus sp. TaxID=2706531 RepID=UPI002D7F32F5|nr:pirin family protein [Segeticoccus sp.]HET8601102.1 pirin family protein [Segeticoccus sp.]
MSNLETRPAEVRCQRGGELEAGEGGPTPAAVAAPERPAVQVLTSREVPLGGPRAMRVHRTLPQRQRSLIGAWCFADHYGPDDVSVTGGMDVPPHPHTGLQTVSWLFSGEIEHRDSLGTVARVRPGELNLMTAGHGICHSEVSTSDTTVLHGAQLWVALPESDRDTARDFAHYEPPAVPLDGGVARVFLGDLAGHSSPVPTFTPLLGAELTVDPGAELRVEVDPGFEHGVLVDTGAVTLEGVSLTRTQIGYHPPGTSRLQLRNAGADPARVLLLGGEPFPEQIIMWWNLVGRSHEDIVTARREWEDHSERFGEVPGYVGHTGRLPAPPLPNARLRPRVQP